MNERHDSEAAAIARADHADPFAYLGPHELEGGRHIVRAFLPGARTARLLDHVTETPIASLEAGGEPGLFQAILPAKPPHPYRLRVDWGRGPVDIVDPYQFSFWLGETDFYLFREGSHFRLYERLGAHPTTLDGVQGVVFAVWAPNAARVSVVGDFNIWDGRRHPMRRHSSAGIWELFMPGLAEGERYNCPSSPIRWPSSPNRHRPPPPSSIGRRPINGRTMSGCASARWCPTTSSR